MAYVNLSDLRNTPLGQTSGASALTVASPEQLEKAASGLEATAKGLRATAIGPAAAALNAQAQSLETQAASLRRAAAQKSTATALPASDTPSKTNWLMIGGLAAGALGLAGAAWAFRKR